MKKLNKLFICTLSIFLVCMALVTTSCNKDNTEEEYQYPSQVPALSSNLASGTFLTINDYKINNNDLYYNLLQSYGVDELTNYMDYHLLESYKGNWEKFDDAEVEADYQEYLQSVKDNVDDNFELAVVSNGLHYTSQPKAGQTVDYLYYDTYYRLEYKRFLKGLELFEAETAETNAQAKEDAENDEIADDDKTAYVYEEQDIIDYFNDNYHQKVSVVLVRAASEQALIKSMAEDQFTFQDGDIYQFGNKIDDIEMAFIKIADRLSSTNNFIIEGTYEDFSNINGGISGDTSIADKIYALADGEYTKAAVHAGNIVFMVYRDSTGSDYYNDADSADMILSTQVLETEDGKATKLSDELMKKMEKELIKSLFYSSSTTAQYRIDRAMLEARQAAGLEIYAEGVEIQYKSAFDSVYSSLDITDYEAFKATSNTSSTLVAKWNGGEISADNMFGMLVSRYGALVGMLFVQQYAILANKANTVIELATGKVLDQDAYDEFFATDLTEIKESFNEGGFESYGYPVSYGWDNFMRDYLGYTSEAAAVLAFNSSLYESVYDLYTKSLYMVDTSELELTKQTISDVEYYALTSEKWSKVYVTDVKTSACKTAPVISIAYSDADITKVEREIKDEKEVEITKPQYYGHVILTFTNTEDKEVSVITEVTADQKVMDKYRELTNETFSATVAGLKAYYDKDADGEMDEFTNDSTGDNHNCLTVVEQVWFKAVQIYNNTRYFAKTFVTCLNEAIDWYKTTDDLMMRDMRALGVCVSVATSETYSNTTTQNAELKAQVKKVWTMINEFTIPAQYTSSGEAALVTSVAGQTIDSAYRFVKDDEVFTVTPFGAFHYADGTTLYDFESVYQAVECENYVCKVFVTKTTAKTTSSSTQVPSLYYYEQSLLDSEDREVTLTCSSLITAYYTPAIKELASDTIVNAAVLDECKAILAKTSFSSDYSSLMDALTLIIDEAIKANQE